MRSHSCRRWRRTGCGTSARSVLRVFGTFSASTNVATFERPFEPGGPQVIVIGAPVPVAVPLEQPVLA